VRESGRVCVSSLLVWYGGDISQSLIVGVVGSGEMFLAVSVDGAGDKSLTSCSGSTRYANC